MMHIDQARTIAFLSRPESYRTADEVAYVETHAAIVFLVGGKAYKLKRAIKYPFLDYSTVALREKSARAELTLNRRTAPQLYLDVVPVSLTPDGRLSLDETGEVVDWLVVMRRFKEENLLSRIADQGALPRPLLQRLADRIVDFHNAAEVRKDYGGAAAMRRVIELNHASMSQHPETLATAEVDDLRQGSLTALDDVATLLDRRRDNGFVRHCHGDLHLRNICLIEGEPAPFDCIEFSEDLACIDVLYDLAFLLMDLWCRNHHGEANFIFNRYLDMNDDGTGGMAALPLFLSMRAAVRAHVAAAAASLLGGDGRKAEAETARCYLNAAIQFLQIGRPSLVAIGGLSGTGKSTLAYALAPFLGRAPGARVLRSDVLRKRLMHRSPEERLSKEAYSSEINARVYGRLEEQAGQTLSAGHAVIADAVFGRGDERSAIAAAADKAGSTFVGLWLKARVSQLEARLRGRIGDASDATIDVLHRQLQEDVTTPHEWHQVDAGNDAKAVLSAVKMIAGCGREVSRGLK